VNTAPPYTTFLVIVYGFIIVAMLTGFLYFFASSVKDTIRSFQKDWKRRHLKVIKEPVNNVINMKDRKRRT
jgi:hypothetical protein